MGGHALILKSLRLQHCVLFFFALGVFGNKTKTTCRCIHREVIWQKVSWHLSRILLANSVAAFLEKSCGRKCHGIPPDVFGKKCRGIPREVLWQQRSRHVSLCMSAKQQKHKEQTWHSSRSVLFVKKCRGISTEAFCQTVIQFQNGWPPGPSVSFYSWFFWGSKQHNAWKT